MQRKRIQTKNELLRNNASTNNNDSPPASGTNLFGNSAGSARFDENDVYPRIHGMVFNVADGVLNKIPVDFKRRVGSLDHIYGLYSRANPILS